ncbi:vesicle-trafficking protein SEC22b isoform X1 [Sphaerodactylus townsendi]|uniref:vesicle-trafficking protein SEC22b isoform X1 n=1 Tax=Sphaerodactylus townsendi TaxID=933632 RepID=UPI0020260A46|nr:vesicle-trafficking protein SEC22b isoform X1 [Sphaerodactylus townsendi]
MAAVGVAWLRWRQGRAASGAGKARTGERGGVCWPRSAALLLGRRGVKQPRAAKSSCRGRAVRGLSTMYDSHRIAEPKSGVSGASRALVEARPEARFCARPFRPAQSVPGALERRRDGAAHDDCAGGGRAAVGGLYARGRAGRDLQQYQSQAKQLFRKLNEQSPTRCTLEAGAMAFHYIIEKGVCYLVLCEAVFPKKLAFAYLEDLHSEFDEQHGKKVPTVSRPYSFIEFDTYIQKTKKLYIDSRARRNLGSINTELQDVQRIMVANIEEVLQRGEALSALDSKANNLSSLSKKYRQDAKYLNMRSTYAKLAAVAVFFIMLIVYVRFWWL